MGKRKGEILSFSALLLVFMLTTVFFYMLYNMHYDSASDDFTGITVFDYESEPGMETGLPLGTLREDLAEWADNNHAVLFYKGFSSPGIAAVDYAGWFDKTWEVAFDGQESKTAIVMKNNGNANSYADGGVLFPGIYNYQIVGEFAESNAPTFQGDAFFYFPLSDITNMQGVLYTNIESEESLAELTGIIEKTGRSAEYQTYGDRELNIIEIIMRMFFDDFVSRSMLFAFLGLVFSAIFALSMMYRESNRYMAIHHLYGATYMSLFAKLIICLLFIAVSGTILGYFFGRTQLHLIHEAAYLKVAVLAGVCNVLFVCVIQTICFLSWRKNTHGKEGRY